MARSRNEEEISLIEAAMGVLAGFIHLLVKLANEMKLSAGALYRLGTEEGEETLKLAVGAFLAEVAKTVPPLVKELPPPAPPILLPFRTISVVGSSRFIPGEKIRVGTVDGVKIVYVDSTLEALMKGLIEENIPPANLRVERLARRANSSEISDELAERLAFFSDLWELVKLQPRGEKGTLHIDGQANLIKIQIGGFVWLVSARFGYWDVEHGWGFDAYQAASSVGWDADRQVISRDSDTLAI